MRKLSIRATVWLFVLCLALLGQVTFFQYSKRANAAGITGAYFASHTNILLVSGSGFGGSQGASSVTVDGTSLGAASTWSDTDVYYSSPAKSSGILTINIDGGGSYSASISQFTTYTPYPSDPDINNADLVAYYPFDGDFNDKKSALDLNSFNQKLYGSGKFNGKYESIYSVTNPTANLTSGGVVLRIGSQLFLYYYDDVYKYSVSSDDGATWGAMQAAPAAPYGMPRLMDNGEWLYMKRGGWPSPSFEYCHATSVTVDNVFNPPGLTCGAVDAAAYTAMSAGWGSFYTQWGFETMSGGRVIWPVYRYWGPFGAAMIYSEDYGHTWGFKPISSSNVVNGLSLTSAVTAGDTTIAVNDVSGLTESGVVKLTNGATNETVSYGGISGNTLTNVRKGDGGQYLVGAELNAQSAGTTNSFAVLGTTVMQNFATPGEPTIVTDPNNRNHLILFERHEGGAGSYILKSESTDFGDNWTLFKTIYIGDNATGEPVRGNNHYAFWTANAGGAQGRIYIFARHWRGEKYFYSDDSGATWHGSNAQASTKTDNNYTVRVGNTWELANDMDSNSFIEEADGSGIRMFQKWALDDDVAPGTGTVRTGPVANLFLKYSDTSTGKNLGYANSAYDAKLNLNTYSLDFWMNIRQSQRNIDQTIISRTSSDGAKANYDIKIVGSGANLNKIQFRQYNDLTSSWDTIYSTSALSNDSWYHVVATYDGTKIRLYMNGFLNSEATSTSTHSGTETLQIGYDVGSDMRVYRGQLDNLKIWSKALFSVEILARSNWAAPSISSVSPSSTYAGSVVTISGSGFGDQQLSSTVSIGGVIATVISWSDTIIVVTVPVSLTSGSKNVVVLVAGFVSNSVAITVQPFVITDLPATGQNYRPVIKSFINLPNILDLHK